jgi:hypothetical protein
LIAVPEKRSRVRHRHGVTTPGSLSVTEDLLGRCGEAPGVVPGTLQTLVLQYVRAHRLDDVDLRHFVLHPDRSFRISPGTSFGFGRAPIGADVAVPLVEEDGLANPAVPRLAAQLEFQKGSWWLANRSQSGAVVIVSAPGLRLELTNTMPPLPMRMRRMLVTVPSRSADGEPVEHRFTAMLPGMAEDLPTAAVGDPDGMMTANRLAPPGWSWAQQRLLAAWAYPELIGLPPRGIRRGWTTRQLLRQPLTGKDPNEKPLTSIRRRAGRLSGVPMVGESTTPAFLSHVVARRGYLGVALAALHDEYLGAALR